MAPRHALKAFLQLRTELRGARVGDGGRDTCLALTAALDDALRAMAGVVDGQPVAVVALGGYGRSRLCLASDVDVMLLHDGADTGHIVRELLYPLWDANLKVGHAVRTVAESATAARDRFETLTSLLASRHVAGDAALTAALDDAMRKVVFGRPLSPKLADLERERRRRVPYPRLAADVKEDRGGLRTLQGLWWERRRAELLGLPADHPGEDERTAEATLLAVRNALHATVGRAMDSYESDLREAVARWLGSDPVTVSAALCRALRSGDRLAERRWPDLLVPNEPLAGIASRMGRAVRSRFAPPRNGAPRPGPLAAAAAACTGSGAIVLPTPPDPPPATSGWDEADRRNFVSVVSAGWRGRVAFDWLEETGWIAANFPEWLPIVALPEPAPFHEHPVDIHAWRTVDEMRSIIDRPDRLASEILAELGSTEELLLAALLHDVGKGSGRDHSVAGAEAAARFLRRAGWGPATLAEVTAAVRHHLLLARTATRSDIADPEVIETTADSLPDLRTLQIVYLLTMADARATGRTMWTEWKAALVRELYFAVAARLGGGEAPAAAVDAAAVHARSGGRFTERQIGEHLAALPPDYGIAVDAGDVLWHLDAIASIRNGLGVSPHPTGRRVAVVGADRRGFLLAVCRAFAASGVAVLGARLATRADGTVVDVFEVRDDRSGDPVPEERWEKVRTLLAATLAGERDLRAVVAERAAAYPVAHRSTTVVRSLDPDAHRHTVLEVRAPDQIGLLAAIAEALHGEGLDVHLAVIDTRGEEAVDTFHVRRLGVPVRAEAELDAMCRRLEDRLRA